MTRRCVSLLLLGRDPLASRYLVHAFHPARRLDDLFQVREVLDLDNYGAVHLSVRRMQIQAADVGARPGDGGGQVRIQAAAIRRLERESHDEALALCLLPIDLETALGFVRKKQQVRTVRPVYAHAPASGDITDNRIARYRLTTLRVPHHDAVDALDAHALAAANAVDEPLDDRRWLWRLGRLQFRMQQPKYCGDLHIALTDGRHQVRRVGETQRLGDLAQLFLGRFGDPAPAKLALEDLLSDPLRRLMLLALEH